MTDLIRQHIRTVLQHELELTQARQKLLRDYESKGHHLITGGQVDHDTWHIDNYRTGETIVEGDGGFEKFLEVLDSGQAETWVLVESITDDLDEPSCPSTEGLPESMCEVLADWATTAQAGEVAAFAGWPLNQVIEARDF